jgi:hypothetical protein
MPKRLIFSLILVTAIIGPASAQDTRGSIRTETQERLVSQQGGSDLLWNLVGLLGLFGLLGFRSGHSEDSYHPAPVE